MRDFINSGSKGLVSILSRLFLFQVYSSSATDLCEGDSLQNFLYKTGAVFFAVFAYFISFYSFHGATNFKSQFN